MTKTINAQVALPTVSVILSNLAIAHGDNASIAFSNAAKAFERKEWLKVAIRENRLNDFLATLEETINALPAGDVVVKSFSKKTGESKDKKINYRDVAKKSLVTAFNNAVSDLPHCEYAGKVLVWKMSRPETSDKAIKIKTLKDKVAGILGETIDSQGLDIIMLTISEQQARFTESIAHMAENIDKENKRNEYITEFERLVKRGKTTDQATRLVTEITGLDSGLIGITVEDIQAIMNTLKPAIEKQQAQA